MPLGSLLVLCARVVNDRDEPVTVLSNVENHVSLHIVGILERAANFREIVPSSPFDDNNPCLDLVRRIRALLHGLMQMFARDDSRNGTTTETRPLVRLYEFLLRAGWIL
jgi:hypothetical protein